MSERSVFSRLYHGDTNIDFIGRTKLWFGLSAALIIVGLIFLFTRGLNLGIDFEGGISWEVPAHGTSVEDTRDALEPFGLADAKIQRIGDNLRVQAEPDAADVDEVRDALVELTGSRPGQVSVTDVGPSWGDEISKKAQRALAFFLVAITIYITLRFEWKMAVATLAALIHDLLVTVGVYSITGFEVTPATVIAILTILGYSIYDGIVVFDRVDENAKSVAPRASYGSMVNRSLNEVLMRTLNTSIMAILPVLSLLIVGSYMLGAVTLQDFALALFIGLLSGAYSSIFIASPLLVILKEREPRYKALKGKDDMVEARPVLTPKARKSAAAQPASTSGTTTATAVDVDLDDDGESADGDLEPAEATGPANRPAPPRPSGPPGYRTGPPRGRKKGKRR